MNRKKLTIAVILTVVIVAGTMYLPVTLSAQTRAGSSELFKVLPKFARLKDFYPFGKRGPMPVVYAAGEPYEMGYQIGAQLREVFPHKDLLKWQADGWGWDPLAEYYDLTDRDLIIEKYMKRYWEEVIVREFGEEVADDYWQEMQGVADGYNHPEVDFWDIMIINLGIILWDWTGTIPYVLWVGLPDGNGDPPPEGTLEEGCSGSAAWGSATKDGKMICAHNDDGWSPVYIYMYMLIVAPSKGHAFAGATQAGNLFYAPGMNDAGVYIAGNAVTPSNWAAEPAQYGLPHVTLKWRYAIQYSDTARDAANFFIEQSYHTDSGYGNIQCVDENEAIYLTVATGGGYVEWEPLDDFIIITNHCVPDVWADGNPTEYWLKYRPTTGSTIYRYQSLLRSYTMNYGDIDLCVVRDAHSSHYNVVTGEDPCIDPPWTVCRHHKSDWGRETAKCDIGIPHKRLLYTSYGAPCIAVWHQVNLNFANLKQKIAQEAALRMRQLGY